MTEQSDDGAAAATPGAPAANDQADSGAQAVDLEAEVAKAARKAEREAQKRVSLDLIDNPEHRKIAESWTSQQLNEYRKKLAEGKDTEFVRTADVERMLRQERKAIQAEAEAKEKHRELLTEFGIRKGTEDYEKFAAAAAYVDKTKLADRAAVELIARGAGVGVFKAKAEIPAGGLPFLASGGVPLQATENGQNTTDPELAAIQADYHRRTRRG